MATGRRHKTELGIVELAVDPADVDRDTYPVKIRLTRTLTSYEVSGLAEMEPGLTTRGDCLIIPAARLDDVARECDTWAHRLEQAQSRADELEGETWIADSRRLAEQSRHGSHMRSQQADDRGLH